MPRVTFTADFDYSPSERKGLVTIAYKNGDADKLVKQECADQAIALGRAFLVEEEKPQEAKPNVRRRASRQGVVPDADGR